MAAIAPPPRVEVGRSGKATWLGGAIGVPHAHWLKLRHKVTVTERLNLELGELARRGARGDQLGVRAGAAPAAASRPAYDARTPSDHPLRKA